MGDQLEAQINAIESIQEEFEHDIRDVDAKFFPEYLFLLFFGPRAHL